MDGQVDQSLLPCPFVSTLKVCGLVSVSDKIQEQSGNRESVVHHA